MNKSSTILKLATTFEKLSARQYTPLRCETCGYKWEALSPRAGKGGMIRDIASDCPQCGGEGTPRAAPRIELDPHIQAPHLTPKEKRYITRDIPRHIKELGEMPRPKFHAGQRVQYKDMPGTVLNPLVHHHGDINHPEKRFVSVQFDHIPAGPRSYRYVKEQELNPLVVEERDPFGK